MDGMKQFSFGFLIFFAAALLCAQGTDVQFSYNGSGNYYLVERTDLRRYDNGKYTGLVSREVRSFIARTVPPKNSAPGDAYYDGSFFVQEGTIRDSRGVGSGIHTSIPSSFRITRSGQLFMLEDNGYPSFRSFPAFPADAIKKGDKWVSKAERAVDPLYKGKITKIPMTVEYTYLRDETFHGEDVYVLSAQWATRYGISYWDFGGDLELKSANGKHSATMYISKNTGNAVVVRDSVDETFIYADGSNVSFKGTISLFTEYPPAVDRSRIIPALQRASLITKDEANALAIAPKNTGTRTNVSAELNGSAEPKTSGGTKNTGGTSGAGTQKAASGKAEQTKPVQKQLPSKADTQQKIEQTAAQAEKPITVENTEAGIRLTMQNLRFKADSAELLPEEAKRLDQIAAVLKEAPQSQFLVEGHTASTGNEKGEQRLSEERARNIALELSKRGIAEDKFICKGSGGRKPVASNATPEGKARNRRVEITILE